LKRSEKLRGRALLGAGRVGFEDLVSIFLERSEQKNPQGVLKLYEDIHPLRSALKNN
jgi:hypothetical protein